MEPPGGIQWSPLALPLDTIVSRYKLPLLLRVEPGQAIEGLRDGDLVLVHSCRQWTAVTAHSLEEGHYVVGPKIEIPVHYSGKFKLLEQERDMKDPVQYFNSVEEVAKAFPDRVFVMEDISFSVKVASGEFSEDSEVYNFSLSTGDELTLMGQAEILCGKPPGRDRFRLNALLRKLGRLNAAVSSGGGGGNSGGGGGGGGGNNNAPSSVLRPSKGKMPCLICMNHRTNESLSLPFQCRGRFGTRSPLELRLREGEHTLRSILERARLPVSVQPPSAPPPRNPYDQHSMREGHRYKLVGIRAKMVAVCCAIRPDGLGGETALPLHFTLQVGTTLPRFALPEGLACADKAYERAVRDRLALVQRSFDIDEFSRAVREAPLVDPPPPAGGGGSSGATTGGRDVSSPKPGRSAPAPHGGHVPYTREPSGCPFQQWPPGCAHGGGGGGRLQLGCFGGGGGGSEASLARSSRTCSSEEESPRGVTALPPLSRDRRSVNDENGTDGDGYGGDGYGGDGGDDDGDDDGEYVLPEEPRAPPPPQSSSSSSHSGRPPGADLPYEELWSERAVAAGSPRLLTRGGRGCRGEVDVPGAREAAAAVYSSPPRAGHHDRSLPPPPLPPKSQAVKAECRAMQAQAPPVPPRSTKPPSTPTLSPRLPPRTPRPQLSQAAARSPSPSLSYYSSGLHHVGVRSNATWMAQANTDPGAGFCYPCGWTCDHSNGGVGGAVTVGPQHDRSARPSLSDGQSVKTSWSETWSRGSSESDGGHYLTPDASLSKHGNFFYGGPRPRAVPPAPQRRADAAAAVPAAVRGADSPEEAPASRGWATGCGAPPPSLCPPFGSGSASPADGGDPFDPFMPAPDERRPPAPAHNGCCVVKQPVLSLLARGSLPPFDRILSAETAQPPGTPGAAGPVCPLSPPRPPKPGRAAELHQGPLAPSPLISSWELPVENGTEVFSLGMGGEAYLRLSDTDTGPGGHELGEDPWRPPLDLAGLSVEGVCRCLRFLGLPEGPVAKFSSEKVDGSLLAQLSEEMLLNDFGLGKLQARKLLQFVAGWRPKL
ncbi:unnamed protein product [Lampetra planeri]